MNMVRRACAAGACLAAVTTSVWAWQTPEPAPYVRTSEDRGGAVLKLELTVREFTPADESKPHVFLAGAVHIGERSFYKSLQEFLDGQDVVLFEGVKPPGAGAAEQDLGGGTDAERAETTTRRVRFIAMAVDRYRARHDGRLPESLAALSDGSEARIAG